jgi:hypothetical protein
MHETFASLRNQLTEADAQEALLTTHLSQLSSILGSIEQSSEVSREV